MQLPPEAIKEFKEIYKKDFGEELSDQEAYDKALSVLHVFAILLQEDNDLDNH